MKNFKDQKKRKQKLIYIKWGIPSQPKKNHLGEENSDHTITSKRTEICKQAVLNLNSKIKEQIDNKIHKAIAEFRLKTEER